MIPATAEVKKLLKTEHWVERMTSPQLKILARLNPDLCEIHEVDKYGRKRTIVKPECRNRYELYKLLRSKRRCPKNKHGEEILKTLDQRSKAK
jgi:hypothetical protein